MELLTSNLPKVTIAIATYNGANKLPRTIESVINLKYPRKKLQIIVVDDASTDDISEVATKYGVSYIKHNINLGVSAARNTGLANARGEYFASLDDDCELDTNWLIKLLESFEGDDIVGVGGKLVSVSDNKSLLIKYFNATGYGSPTPLRLDASRGVLSRFSAYLKDSSRKRETQKRTIVRELMGANALYKTELLRSVSGWDVDLRASEDVDLCIRLSRMYPKGMFIFQPKAILKHVINITAISYIRRAYTRASYTHHYYKKNKLVPPFMPFPVMVLILVILGFYTSLGLGILSLIAAPLICYCWWIYRAIAERQFSYFVFPYFEFSLQFVINLKLFFCELAGKK